MKIIRRHKRVYNVMALILLCMSLTGCVESNFLLASDSRLPNWMKLPDGLTRSDVTVSLFLYGTGKARFVVRGPTPQRKALLNIVASADWHEATLREKGKRGNYDFSPQYYTVTYNGITDIIKFTCKGPVFWMADSIDLIVSDSRPECPPIDYNLIGNP